MMGNTTLHVSLALALLAVNSASAEEPDDHAQHVQEAHVHGAWELFAALDGKQLSVTLIGPIVDVLGFEHPPKDETELAAVDKLKGQLREPDMFLALNARAGCSISEPASIEFPKSFAVSEHRADHDDDHDHQEEHGDQKHGDHGEHDEQDSGHESDQNHDDHDLHASNVETTYVFKCASPSRLVEIDLTGFDTHTAIENVDAVFLSDTKQAADRLHKSKPTLKLN